MKEFSQEKLEQKKLEQREKEPRISYHFLFGPHETAEDYKKLKEVFQKADIYIPELCGRLPRYDESNLNALSKGEIIPKDLARKWGEKRTSAAYQEFRVIYNSKKPILLCDIPIYNFHYSTKSRLADYSYKKGMSFFKKGDFKKSLLKIRSTLETEVKLELGREGKIKKNLNNKIGKFLKKNPKYTQKENLKVLVNLGAYHTKIYQNLAEEREIPVSREFSQTPFVYSNIDEAQRRILFNKELKDELIARSLLEDFLDPLLSEISDNSQKIDRVSRKISSQLTLEDIEKISKNFTRNNYNIIRALEEFKIKVPQSKEEMNKML